MTAPVSEMAVMRCLTCEYVWEDLDAAITELLTPCPGCHDVKTEPMYAVDGAWQPPGWTWEMLA